MAHRHHHSHWKFFVSVLCYIHTSIFFISDNPRYDFSQSVYTEFEFNDLTVNATVDANPLPNIVTWTRNGQAVSGSGILTTLTSISFTNLTRGDNGTYSISSNNGIGDGSGSFDLIVYCKPMKGVIYNFNCLHSK